MDKKVTAGNHGDRVRSDCRVTLQINVSGGIDLKLKSKVGALFGKQITAQIREALGVMGVDHASVELEDSGALPFVIGARLEAAVRHLLPGAPPWMPPLSGSGSTDSEKERFRCSRLYLPGNTPAMMLNAGIHQPQGIILDLEDSVAPSRKAEARILVRNALRSVDFCGAERMVRINQLPAGEEDLEEIVPQPVQVILVPKCESAEQIRKVEERITRILADRQQERTIFLMPILESCLGVENAFRIATASPLVAAMAIGLEDYSADLGVPRTAGGEESFYARTRLVNACKAAGIQPIDSVYSDVDDMEGLEAAVRRSRSLGFEGMGCIHPRQVAPIHRGFTPSGEEIEQAEKIIAAYHEAGESGRGVVALGSKMIDAPVVERARQTLELARRFGFKENEQ